MLKNWKCHAEYQQFVISNLKIIYKSTPNRIKELESYKIRTCSERINNRILNNYKIHSLRFRGKMRYSFMTMIVAINIHLDARIKASRFNLLSLVQ